ncbi:AIPR family protein [Priestia aryabhattai]|uniref:AIPR family protein n=1 Tax=Priestia aryabhattai TaxID=412384 RepID=UPI00210CCC95|nr:AIPR family protein [Priestia aryabhattai]
MKKDLKSITFKVERNNVFEMILNDRKFLFMAVRTDDFLNKDIPNKANSREFTGEKNPSVRNMKKTLNLEPEMFHSKNLGVRMAATDFIRKEDEITLFFNKHQGIFNGRHTQQVLKKFGKKKAYVLVMVDFDLPQQKLVDISVALNMSKSLELISIGEKKGAFEWVKEALPTESIIYKEGGKGVYYVTDVFKVANLFKIGNDRKYSKVSLKKSLLRKNQIIEENTEKQSLTYTKFILSDMWELYKDLRSNLIIQNNLPKKYSKENELLNGLTLFFIYGIQYMTEINKNNIPVWKEGYSSQIALKICEKLSKDIGKILSKPPYTENTVEWLYRESKFSDVIKRIFADELM